MAELTGAKVNVYSERPLTIEGGQRGIVAMALPLNWGGEELLSFHRGEDGFQKLGYSLEQSSLIMVREVMKRALKVLLYNLNSNGAKATGSIATGITAEAIHPGVRGNDISVTVVASGSNFTVKTFVETELVDAQTIKVIGEFKKNPFVKIAGTGTLVAKTVKLTGGTNGTQASTAYDTFLSKLQINEYDVIAYTGNDVVVKNKIISFIKSQREEEDKGVQAVMGNMEADYEGIISYCNGVVLRDGKVFTPEECSAWLAGATASATVNQSLTYDTYDQALDVTPRFTKAEILDKKAKGLGTFILNGDKAKLESDINTYISFNKDKNQDFCKNRVLRVIDAASCDIKNIFDSNYAGKEDNSLNGRNRFKGAIVQYLSALQDINAIEEFTSEDVEILAGNDKDQILVKYHIKPADAMEKASITVYVR